MVSTKEVTFSSFLAGMLLLKKDIKYSEISLQMSLFQLNYNVDVVDDEDLQFACYETDIFSQLLFFDDNGIHLIKDYNDFEFVNNSLVTVYDYLYSITNDDIRKYFNIQSRVKVNKRTKTMKAF